jgi:hypothetical protein
MNGRGHREQRPETQDAGDSHRCNYTDVIFLKNARKRKRKCPLSGDFISKSPDLAAATGGSQPAWRRLRSCRLCSMKSTST